MIERLRVTRLEAVLGGTAIVLAVAAFWLTLEADFLAHPGWLAVQKADVIVGPVLVGLYWHRRRPRSRFGPLLIIAGFLHAPYILQSSAEPWAFAFGVAWESVIYVVTLAVILAFPTGRLDGVVERVLVAGAAIGVTALYVVSLTLSPTIAPVGTISVCEPACPENGWLITADAGLAAALSDTRALLMVAIAIVAVALIVWRFMVCTPPRRRALAIGTPIALVFLVTQIARQLAAALDARLGRALHRDHVDERGLPRRALVRVPVRAGRGRAVRRTRVAADRDGVARPAVAAPARGDAARAARRSRAAAGVHVSEAPGSTATARRCARIAGAC